MAAFFADVAQVTAAIFWFSIVIVKLVSLFFNRQNAWFKALQKNEARRMPFMAIPVCFPCLTKFQSTFLHGFLKKWILSFKPTGGLVRTRTH